VLLNFFEPSSQRLLSDPHVTTYDDYDDEESRSGLLEEEISNQMK
jgi:hypothetical protein